MWLFENIGESFVEYIRLFHGYLVLVFILGCLMIFWMGSSFKLSHILQFLFNQYRALFNCRKYRLKSTVNTMQAASSPNQPRFFLPIHVFCLQFLAPPAHHSQSQ
eukprot:Sdes_comp22896_c0_seq1m21272